MTRRQFGISGPGAYADEGVKWLKPARQANELGCIIIPNAPKKRGGSEKKTQSNPESACAAVQLATNFNITGVRISTTLERSDW